MLIDPLKITTPIAGFNGGLFVHADMSIIESHTLDPAAAKRTVDLIEQQGLDVWVYAGDDWLLRDMNAPHREREEHTVKFAPKVVKAFTDEHLKIAVKIVGVSDDLDKVAACEKAVQEALGKTASAARSQPYYLDVTHPEANKGGVVAYLSRTMEIDAGQIATIGDQPNDVLMFKPSGFCHRHGQCQRRGAEGSRRRHGQLRRRGVRQGGREVPAGMTGIVDIQADGAAVARRVAEWVLERALATPGRFAWCLSGGSTPKTTLALLRPMNSARGSRGTGPICSSATNGSCRPTIPTATTAWRGRR